MIVLVLMFFEHLLFEDVVMDKINYIVDEQYVVKQLLHKLN